MNLNMIEWKRGILTSGRRAAIPLMTHPGLEIINRTVREAATDADCQIESVKALTNSFRSAAATLMMDLSIETEAFGAQVRFTDNEIPTTFYRTIHSSQEVEALAPPSLEHGRIPNYLRAARMASEQITDRPVFATCIGPFSLAARLFDVSETLVAVLEDPETIAKLVETCTKFQMKYSAAIKSTGVNGLIIAEPVAGLLSPKQCEEFSSAFVKRIVDHVQDDSFLAILHNCGDTNLLIHSMLGTGAAGLHFGNRCDIIAALADLPRDVLVLGNLDPVNVFKSADTQAVRQATVQLLQQAARFKNFVLSSGCDIPPGTPLTNIAAFFDALEEF